MNISTIIVGVAQLFDSNKLIKCNSISDNMGDEEVEERREIISNPI